MCSEASRYVLFTCSFIIDVSGIITITIEFMVVPSKLSNTRGKQA